MALHEGGFTTLPEVPEPESDTMTVPSEPAASPSTDTPPASPQVVVIGAGPAGLTAAYELAKHDISSTVLESDDVVGGISPVGQKRSHPSVLDESALRQETILVSGGRRGLDLELAPGDLVRVTQASVAPIARA